MSANHRRGGAGARKLGLGITTSTAALALGTLMPQAAHAQIGSSPTPPPVFQQVDGNGVELQTGKIVKSLKSISIGPNGPGGLRYVWGTDMSVMTEAIGFLRITSDNKISVVIGGSTETFTGPPGAASYTQDQGRGSTLSWNAATATYTYTGSDGSSALFRQNLVAGAPSSPDYKIVSLTYPAGQTLTYYYGFRTPAMNGSAANTFDLQAVTSNLGYQLRFTYPAGSTTWSKVVAFNMNSETCDPTAVSCTLTGTWPSLTWDPAYNRVTDTAGQWTQWTGDSTYTTYTYSSGRSETYNLGSSNVGWRVYSYSDGKGLWRYQYPNQIAGGVTLVFNPDVGAPRTVSWSQTTGLLAYDTPVSIDGSVVTNYTYDANQRLTRVLKTVNGSGAVVSDVRYVYDSRGNVTETRQVSTTPGTPADIVVSASYPASCGNPKTCNKPDYTWDARNNRTDYTYDPNHGGVTSVKEPGGQNGIRPETRYSYTQVSANFRNGSGAVIAGTPIYMLTGTSECVTGSSCIGTADESKTVINYGPNDALEPTSTTRSAGDNSIVSTTTMTYYPIGDVKTVDGPRSGTGDTLRNYYDSMRRPTGMIGPDPDGAGLLLRRAVRTTYNGDGAPILTEAGTATNQSDSGMSTFQSIEQTAIEYDAQGRKSKESFSTGGATSSVTQYSYTAAGAPECVAVRMTPSAFGSLPASACSQTPTPGSFGPDRISRTYYDYWFRVSSVRSGVGTSAERADVANTYDALGHVLTTTDANGNKTTYAYDGMGRRKSANYPDKFSAGTSSSTDYETFGYDAASNLTTYRNRAGQTIISSFDARNNPVSETAPAPYSGRTYSYDNLDHVRTASVAGGQTVTTWYDALGRVTQQDSPLGSVRSQFDPDGNRTRLTWPDNSSVDYDYNDLGMVTAIRETGQFSGQGALAAFSYDNLGRRTGMSRGNGTTVGYGYADARFSSITQNLAGNAYDQTTSYGHNPNDELTSQTRANSAYQWYPPYDLNRTYSVNGLNQYSAAGGVPYSYDGNGNLAAAGSNTFQYDHLNRLVNASTSYGQASLQYDALDRLYQVGTSRFLYDGDDLIAEYDSSGNLLHRYVHGLSDDEPLVWYYGPGTANRYWLSADERGSITAIADGTGAALALNSYDEFGVPGSNNAGRFQFTGQIWLPEIGLYSYKARLYSPSLGRFMQPDPIGYADNMNLYAYVANDPLNGWDPSGLCMSGRSDATCPDDPHNLGPDIVVTGRREQPSFEQTNQQFARNNYAQWAQAAFGFGVSLLPGYDAVQCVRNGCSVGGWALAALDVVPIGKGGKLLFKGALGARALARTGKLGGLGRRLVGACGCVEAGTLVATPTGYRTIESLKVGELVLAKNEVTGEVAAKPITELVRPEPKPIIAVMTLSRDGNVEAVAATADHPWLVEGKGWVTTGDLRPNDRVTTAGGSSVEITSLKPTKRVVPTYNLEVADWHTFLVGHERIVAHNSCPIGGSGKYRIHNVNSPTRSRAMDRARSASARGQTPMEHSNPVVGGPHFHAVDHGGNKVPGVHFNYPKK